MTGLTHDQTNHLKRLNRLLKQKEKELLARCKIHFKAYEKRLIKPIDQLLANTSKVRRIKNGRDLNSYHIDIDIIFSLVHHYSRYTYSKSIYKNDSEERITFGSETDWFEPGFPDINEEWCYTLHCLWDHITQNRREDVFKITNVRFEVHVVECQEVNVRDCEMIR